MSYTQTQINIQGEPQDAFEVYADETKEQTIAFCFDESMARLIAAAPDLLDAIRQIGILNAGKDNDIDWLCSEAITKAKQADESERTGDRCIK